MPWTLNMHATQAILMHFSQSKSTKCEIFAWNCRFFRNHLSQRLETCSIGFGMPQTLNTVPLKPFWCILPSQNQQNVKFWLFSCTPFNKKLQKTSICTGKTCSQRLAKSAHIRFLSMPIAMHYVRTLCDKYFLSYYVFLHFLWEGQDIGFWNMV